MKNNMKQPPMILILQAIGLLFTLLTSFLGMMYLLRGDIIISGLVAFTLVTFVYFLIEFMMDRKGVLTKKKISTFSIFLWSLFLTLSIPLSLLLIHSLNVEFNAKEETQSSFRMKLESLQDMTFEYDKQVNEYLTNVRTSYRKVAAEFINDRNNQAAKDSLLGKPLLLEQAHLNRMDNGNYTQMIDSVVGRFIELKFEEPKAMADSVISSFILNRSYVVDNWNRLTVNVAIVELNYLYKQIFDELSRAFKENHHSGKSFEYAQFDYSTYLDSPKLLWNKYKPYVLILPAFFMMLLLILPYLLTDTPGGYDNKKSFESDNTSTSKYRDGIPL